MATEDYCVRLLIDLVPPPGPHEAITPEAWPRCEEQLGTRLPSDYKDLITVYGGATSFGDHITIYSPFSVGRMFNLLVQSDHALSCFRQRREDSPSAFPWPVWPERGGWLPMGFCSNGETIFWVTVGEIDQWQIAIMEGRGSRGDTFPGPLSRVLRGLLTRRERCRTFPRGFPRHLRALPLDEAEALALVNKPRRRAR